MPSKKTKVKKEREYPPFEKAVKLMGLCADEGIFHTKTDCDDRDDCDYCPVGAGCLALWKDGASNIAPGNKQFTLGRLIECFEKIQKAKYSKKR